MMLTAKKVIPLHQTDSTQALLLSLKKRIAALESKTLYNPQQNYLIVPTEEGSLFLEQQRIIHCTAASSYCEIQMQDKKICVSRTLKWVSDQLASDQFIRVHSSHLINVKAIARYKKQKNPCLELINGAIIPVSRSHRKAIESFFHL